MAAAVPSKPSVVVGYALRQLPSVRGVTSLRQNRTRWTNRKVSATNVEISWSELRHFGDCNFGRILCHWIWSKYGITKTGCLKGLPWPTMPTSTLPSRRPLGPLIKWRKLASAKAWAHTCAHNILQIKRLRRADCSTSLKEETEGLFIVAIGAFVRKQHRCGWFLRTTVVLVNLSLECSVLLCTYW